jgi:hypothetical protein
VSTESEDFRQRLARVEGLVQALESLPDTAAREAARELTRCLLDLHAAGLKRLLDLAGGEVTTRLAGDGLVSSLLLLHGLHPQSAETRVANALERSRSRLRTLGGDVELISATEELVRLRLCGDPDAAHALRDAAEELVVAAVPDVAALEFEEAWDRPPGGRTPLPVVANSGEKR